jgi:ABC-type hemin transport system substrate-binding protein
MHQLIKYRMRSSALDSATLSTNSGVQKLASRLQQLEAELAVERAARQVVEKRMHRLSEAQQAKFAAQAKPEGPAPEEAGRLKLA